MTVRKGSSALLVLWILLAVAGCQRKPRYEPLKGDSTGTAVDSAAVRIRRVQEVWETGGPGDVAAAMTARVLLDRLRSEDPTEWKGRADALLDSLGVGNESAAGPCVLMVNFFYRSDPGAGSWPYLYWCGDQEPLFQGVEGRGLNLTNIVSRGFAAASSPGPAATRAVSALFARRGGGGQQPLLMVWSLPPGGRRWNLVQTLGPDSLGGTGTAEFEGPSDSVELVARTYRPPPYFDECATCPHVFGVHRFRWGGVGFERVEDTVVPSPYSTFVAFIRAMMTNDQDAAEALVSQPSLVEQARRLEWDRPRGAWRIAPAAEETPEAMNFFRGPQEAYRVEFQTSGRQWLIVGFEPTARTLE